MKLQNGLLKVILRVFGVALTAGFCLVLGTAAQAPEPPADAEEYSPLIDPAAVESPEPEYFTLNFVGDCTLASTEDRKSQANSYESVVDGDWAYPFSLTKEYFENDDFTFANLECTLTDEAVRTDKSFCFRADPEYVNILTEGGVDFVSLGNNHSLDCGDEGYADTKLVLDEAGIAYAGRNEYTIYETESGLKIGVYADSFGTADDIKAGITALKEAGAEFIIAALHWGDEGSYSVNDTQRELGHAAVDAGADFVYGSHPHTLQPCEEYNGVPIYYSMGNWTFGGNDAPRDPDTIILRLTVERDTDGTVSIKDSEVIPCACTGEAGGNDYRPVPYEEGSEEYLRTLSKLSGTFDGQDLTIGYSYSMNE